MEKFRNDLESSSSADLSVVLAALELYLKGDVEVRIPTQFSGTLGEIAKIMNKLFDNSNKANSEILTVLDSIGKEGRLDQRIELGKSGGPATDIMRAFNQVLDELISPVHELSGIIKAISQGDLSSGFPPSTNGKRRVGEFLVLSSLIAEVLKHLSKVVTGISLSIHNGITKIDPDLILDFPAGGNVWSQLSAGVKTMQDSFDSQLSYISDMTSEIAVKVSPEMIPNSGSGVILHINQNLNLIVRRLQLQEIMISDRSRTETPHWTFTNLINEDQEYLSFFENIFSEISLLLGASHGIFYLTNFSEDGKVTLIPVISLHASPDETKKLKHWKLGEGYVGRSAKESKRILLEDVPSDYKQLAFEDSGPKLKSVLIQPVTYQNKIVAVLELASSSKFGADTLHILDRISEQVGFSLFKIEANARTEELLELTKIQNETLKRQQEMLWTKNRDLEEKSLLLEAKNASIENTNSILLEAKYAVEEEAEKHALTSKYKTQFLSNMSHELRTPLNSLLLLAEYLAKNLNQHLDAKEVEFAKLIQVSGHDLLVLINEVLDLSRIESGKLPINFESVLLVSLLDQVEQSFKHLAEERKLKFVVGYGENLPNFFDTDALRLLQILRNLLANSFKFTEKGEVKLRISLSPSVSTSVFGNSSDSTPSIYFEVQDTGIGIPNELQEVIFEPFQQGEGNTARKFGGTGLGLAISREISILLGGDLILAHSSPGVGSNFILRLPLHSGKQNLERLDSRAVPDNALAGEAQLHSVTKGLVSRDTFAPLDDRTSIHEGDRVMLVIEDNVDYAYTMLRLARKRNFKTVVATTGAQGLALARELNVDSIILDIKIPDIDGWTVLNILKRDPALRHIPVNLITVESDKVRALTFGSFQYLTKPLNTVELNSALDEIRHFLDRRIRNLVLLSSDLEEVRKITDHLAGEDVRILRLTDPLSSLESLSLDRVDCLVIGKFPTDLSESLLIETLRENLTFEKVPIVVLNDNPVSDSPELLKQAMASPLIIKRAGSLDELLDITAIFLHRNISRLPINQRQVIERLQDAANYLNGKSILIVDDDRQNLLAISAALGDKKATIITAENGAMGIEALENSPEVSIVLMDMMMPVMDGFETMRKIRAIDRFKTLPIIALTAKAMPGDRELCIEAGASDYMSKPLNIEQIGSMIQIWLSAL